jgi:hypothetical protein
MTHKEIRPFNRTAKQLGSLSVVALANVPPLTNLLPVTKHLPVFLCALEQQEELLPETV